jgi:hypothetical protein
MDYLLLKQGSGDADGRNVSGKWYSAFARRGGKAVYRFSVFEAITNRRHDVRFTREWRRQIPKASRR